MVKKEKMENVLFRVSEEQAFEIRTIIAQLTVKDGKRITYGMLMDKFLEAYEEKKKSINEDSPSYPVEDTNNKNGQDCLDYILDMNVSIPSNSGMVELTISDAISLWNGAEIENPINGSFDRNNIRKHLEKIGLRPVCKDGENLLYIATPSYPLQKLLFDSGYASSYSTILLDLPACRGIKGPSSFAGKQKRFLEIKI